MKSACDPKRSTRHGRRRDYGWWSLIAIVAIIVLAVMTHPFFVASVLSGMLAVGLTAHLLHIYRRWRLVPGRIVRYRIVHGDGGKFFHPVYRFTTLDGCGMVGTTSWGYWRRLWSPGEDVQVFYCPADPRRTELRAFKTWIGPCTALVLSIAFALIALWFDGPFE